MRQRSMLIGAVVVLVALGGVGLVQSVIGQEFDTTTVICAPCAGEPFGASGTGMVLMRSYNGSGQLWFYSLDRSQAELVRSSARFAAPQELRTTPQLIGRLSTGSALVWSEK